MKKSKNDIKLEQESIPLNESKHVLTAEEDELLDLISKIIVRTTLSELQEQKEERKKAKESGNT